DREALATGLPALSDLGVDPATGETRLVVVAPVAIEGSTRYLLSSGISLDALRHLLNKHQAPASTTLALCDRRGIVVARSSDADQFTRQELPGFHALTEA